ncbi:hypothetical protein QVD17_30885 [Tagetes erecta]|uniref:Uncharacterized protein n=1 Tax=Tagetes erecta TaxID=13708 RepID=A0AAD8NMR1_TARER|nr:hypothetical protein QVD17_30885 [Tagetes erecta]
MDDHSLSEMANGFVFRKLCKSVGTNQLASIPSTECCSTSYEYGSESLEIQRLKGIIEGLVAEKEMEKAEKEREKAEKEKEKAEKEREKVEKEKEKIDKENMLEE